MRFVIAFIKPILCLCLCYLAIKMELFQRICYIIVVCVIEDPLAPWIGYSFSHFTFFYFL